MPVTNRVYLGLLYEGQKVMEFKHQSPTFCDTGGMRGKRSFKVRFVCQRVNVHNQICGFPGRAGHHPRFDESVQP